MKFLICFLMLVCVRVSEAQVAFVDTQYESSTAFPDVGERGHGTAVCIGEARPGVWRFLTAKHVLRHSSACSVQFRGQWNAPSRILLSSDDDLALIEVPWTGPRLNFVNVRRTGIRVRERVVVRGRYTAQTTGYVSPEVVTAGGIPVGEAILEGGATQGGDSGAGVFGDDGSLIGIMGTGGVSTVCSGGVCRPRCGFVTSDRIVMFLAQVESGQAINFADQLADGEPAVLSVQPTPVSASCQCAERFTDIERKLTEIGIAYERQQTTIRGLQRSIESVQVTLLQIDNSALPTGEIEALRLELESLGSLVEGIDSLRSEIAAMREAELRVRIRQSDGNVIEDTVTIFDPDDSLNLQLPER